MKGKMLLTVWRGAGVWSSSLDTSPRRLACPALTSRGGGFVMSEDHFNSVARKPASKDPDYWTYERASEPVRKLIDAQAEIARELALNQSLRQRLSDCVRLYLDEWQAASKAPR